MTSIVVSPIVTGKKSALSSVVVNTETKEEKINFEIFSEKPNLLEYCFTNLKRPAASEFSAPNFFDKSISACSLDTATLTINSRS